MRKVDEEATELILQMLREESIPERPEEITVHESNAAMTNPELSSAHPPSNDTVETVPTISTIRYYLLYQTGSCLGLIFFFINFQL